MASTSSSSAFPPKDTAYTSIEDFKRAAYTAAVDGCYKLSIFDSKAGRKCILNCIGLGNKKQYRAGRPKCSCTADIRFSRNTKQYVVYDSDSSHTCERLDPDSVAGRAATAEMRGRLDALQQDNRGSATVSYEGDECDDVDGGCDASPAPSAQTLSKTRFGRDLVQPVRFGAGPQTKRQRSRSLSSEEVSSSDEEQGRLPAPRSKRLKKASLQSQISALAQGPLLDLPSEQARFTTPHLLVIHIYAWAEQHSLMLRHNQSSARRVVFSWYGQNSRPRCPKFRVVLCEDEDGGDWRITSKDLEHSTELHADNYDPDNNSSPSGILSDTHQRSSVITTSTATSSAPHYHSSPPLHHVHLSSKSSEGLPLHTQPTPPTPSSHTLFTSQPLDLPAFLTSVFSPSSSPPSSSLLLHDNLAALLERFFTFVGLSTTDELAALLLFEDQTVFDLVLAFAQQETVDGRAVTEDEACALVERVLAAKEGMRAGAR
ncbi:hypothetical protein JCM8097_003781 [Rhodosporidiobolus ruineniae]